MVTTEQQLKRANAHLLAWKSIISNNEVLKTCIVSALPSVTEALNCVKASSLTEETHVLVTGMYYNLKFKIFICCNNTKFYNF